MSFYRDFVRGCRAVRKVLRIVAGIFLLKSKVRVDTSVQMHPEGGFARLRATIGCKGRMHSTQTALTSLVSPLSLFSRLRDGAICTNRYWFFPTHARLGCCSLLRSNPLL